MKLNLTRALIAMAVVTLSYTACQKSGTKPAAATTKAASTTTANEDALAIAMATNIYKSMTGGYGGANINQGLNAPASIGKKANNLQLDNASSLCGYVIDTTASSTTTVHDTTKFESDKFKFIYKCVLGPKVNAYYGYDSVFTQDYNKLFVNTTDVVQDYNVVASDTTFKLFACDGRIVCHNSTLVNPTPTATQVYHAINCDYKVLGVIVDIKKSVPDILAGVATYVCSTNDIDPATGPSGVAINYVGNIVFLGNHLAKLTINPNHVYTINLLTGVIVSRG